MIITGRGHGYLSPVITVIAPVLAGGWWPLFKVTLPIAFLVAAPANYLVARRLNSAVTANGRVWNGPHECCGMPMEWWSAVALFFAAAAAAWGLGSVFGVTAGWATFGGLLALASGAAWWLLRRHQARTALLRARSTRWVQRAGVGSPPAHINGIVRMPAGWAATGATRTVRVKIPAPCRRCSGYAAVPGTTCGTCAGSGLGRPVRVPVKVRIPAGCRNGTTIRVPGHGLPGLGGRPNGDLLLTVRLVPIWLPRWRQSRPRPPAGRSTAGPTTAGPTTAGPTTAGPTAAGPTAAGRPAKPRPAAASGTSAASTTRPAAGGSGTITTERFAITVSRDTLRVRRNRLTASGTVLEPYLDLPWPQVARLKFGTSQHDPVIGLYVYTVDGKRRHVMDSAHLSEADWIRFAVMVSASTGHRVTLDLSGRSAPC